MGRLSHVARAVRSTRPFVRRLWDVCCLHDLGHHSHHRAVHLIWRDLEWWDSLLSHWNGTSRWISGPALVSFSDASNLGFGFHSGETLRYGTWPPSARGWHINWKELRTVEMACAEFGPDWSGRRVLFPHLFCQICLPFALFYVPSLTLPSTQMALERVRRQRTAPRV